MSAAVLDVALAACRSIRFAVNQSVRHGGEFSLNDLIAADKLAGEALAKAEAVLAEPDDVSRLICGNIDDLRNSLRFEETANNRTLLERALARCTGRESKTKRHMLEVALRKLGKKGGGS